LIIVYSQAAKLQLRFQLPVSIPSPPSLITTSTSMSMDVVDVNDNNNNFLSPPNLETSTSTTIFSAAPSFSTSTTTTLPSPPDISSLPDLQTTIQSILNSNFDAVLKPAILLLYKYLSNIQQKPYDLQIRSINLLNKIFQEKINKAKYALDYFIAVGFVPYPSSTTTTSTTSNRMDDSHNISDSDPITFPSTITRIYFPESEELQQRLIQALSYLIEAMNILQIPDEERPANINNIQTMKLSSSSSTATATATAIPFDPYKSSVIRTNPNDLMSTANNNNSTNTGSNTTNAMSATERQVEQLKKKKRELEGNPGSVAYNTQVSYL
jgi:hypothetical protein